MTSLTTDPKIRELARQLGLDTRGDCAARLIRHGKRKVSEWNASLPVGSARQLLDLVAGMLSLRIVFIADEADLVTIGRRYASSWPTLEAQLAAEFIRGDTLGILLSHPAPAGGSHRYFAFIDSREHRAIRAYFTAWHEVAHLLLLPDQLAFDGLRRVTAESLKTPKDPVEVLTDQLAGELAFYAPFAEPELAQELEAVGRLTLDGIGRIKDAVAPEGSFSSAAYALVRLASTPTAFLEADLSLKPTEVRQLESDQLRLIESGSDPTPALRVTSVYPNQAAQGAGFEIFRHMRVPHSSVIAEMFVGELDGTVTRKEDQGDWETGGDLLSSLPMVVEAAKFGPVVYAVMTMPD